MGNPQGHALPDGLFYLDDVMDGVLTHAPYATADNFTGAVVDGYGANRIVVTRAMVDALCAAREKAAERELFLLIWDSVRPQRAVDRFVRWSQTPEENMAKERFYPNLEKAELFANGYIAARSGHSRGCAVDLTIVDSEKTPLDMGGGFDLMDARSWHGAAGIGDEAAKNRALLKGIMEACGFQAYEREWWHYSLKKEPFPERYFDFEIRGKM